MRFGFALCGAALVGGCADLVLESHGSGAFLAAGPGGPETAASGVVYSLPTAHVPMTIARRIADDGYPQLVLEFDQPVLFPDPEHTYTLAYTHDSMSDDEVTIRTSADGLLESISTTTSDQSATAALGLVRLAGEIAKLASPLGPMAGALQGGPSLQSGAYTPPRPFSLTLVVDPTAPDLESIVGEALARIGVYDVTVTPVAPAFPGETRSREELAAYCRAGACYRRSAPVSVQAFDAGSGVGVVNTILLPNAGPVGRVDFQRRAFVRNVASATFQDGMLTELSYIDPSETAAAVTAPADIARSILSIPSAVWQSDSETLRAEQDLLAAQRALLDERARLIQTREEYLAIERAAALGEAQP